MIYVAAIACGLLLGGLSGAAWAKNRWLGILLTALVAAVLVTLNLLGVFDHITNLATFCLISVLAIAVGAGTVRTILNRSTDTMPPLQQASTDAMG